MIILDDGELLLVNGIHGASELYRQLKVPRIKLYQAHQIISRTKEDLFITIKNRGFCYFIDKMAEHNIAVKVSAASFSGDYYEYTFLDKKDLFLFNLKFGS